MSKKSLTGFDANNKQILNVADPTGATDGANKQYVDAVAAGRDWKESVRVASTANINLASPGATINGVTMAANDRFLAKDQTTGSQNGIYVWNGAAVAATRATDADTAADLNAGATVAVTEGTVDADTRWTLTTNDPITLGTTSLVFSKDATGSGYQTVQANGSGLTQRSILNIGSGLTAVDNSGSSRTDVTIDASVVVRKYAADCVVTTNPQTFTHSLNSADPAVFVKEASSGILVEADITVTDANNISVNFGGAPTAAQYRVIVKA